MSSWPGQSPPSNENDSGCEKYKNPELKKYKKAKKISQIKNT